MQQDHRKDFYEALEKIENMTSYAISRCADGEASVLRNKTVGNKDGWMYRKDKNLIFRAHLRNSLTCVDKNFVYGISSQNVDEKNYNFLRKFVRQDPSHITFSDIWVNANYDLFNELFLSTIRRTEREVIIITNPRADLGELRKLINVSDFVPIKGNCVTYWEKNRSKIKAQLDLKSSLNDGAVFLIAAGPLTNILIYDMWRVNTNNVYVDVGSTLDPLIFHRKSRGYHNPDHPHRKIVNR